MIIGIFLGISLAVFLSSLTLLILKFSGGIIPISLTGAAIGSGTFYSFIGVALVISIVTILYFISLIKNHHKLE